MSRDDVDYWYINSTRKLGEEPGDQNELEVFDESLFALPPEAGEECEPEATLYVRVPAALKDRCEAAAKAAGLSLNSWAMRCVEAKAASESLGKLLRSVAIADRLERSLKEL